MHSLYSKIATTKTRASLTALLVFLLPFERIPSIDIFSVTIRFSQLVGVALVFVSLGPIVEFYKSKPRIPKIILPMFLFSYLLSALLSTDVKRALMIFVFTVFVAMVASAIAANFTAKDLPKLERYLYYSTVIVLLIGFYQYFGDVFGLSPALTGLREIYTKEVFGFPRIQSTSLEPLYYGSFLLIPYCLLLAKRLIGKKADWRESVLLGALACQVVLTVSRGAIYSAVITLVILGVGLIIVKRSTFMKLIKSFTIVLTGSVIALGLTWGASQLVNSNQNKYSANAKTKQLVEQTGNLKAQNDRLRNRKIAIMAFKDEPLLGIGPGNFSQYAIAEYPKYKKAAPVIVNNEPLELLAEAGIIGFILFVLFVGWIWSSVLINYLKSDLRGSRLSYWAPALLIYAIALAIQYQTFSTLYVMHVWVIIGLLMAFGIKRFTKT